MTKTYCGYIGIIGRPNVGKSTLVNSLLHQKVSITSHKRQTTRRNVLGIKTVDNKQSIYVDTPGIHHDAKRALNKFMNDMANTAIYDVDIVVFIVDVTRWTDEDDLVLNKIKQSGKPMVLVANKIDEINKVELMAALTKLSEKVDAADIVPISALKGENLDALEAVVAKHLPENPFFFPEDQKTDQQTSFLVSEVIREKLFNQVHQEIPYSTAVAIEKMEEEKDVLHIYATIFVEKRGQKVVIIGKKGEKIKSIGKAARVELEKHFGQRIYLQLWVKIKDSWASNENSLKGLGFER